MRVSFLLLCVLISISVISGCTRFETEFQFEPGDPISVEVLQKESFPIAPDIPLDDAVIIVELILSRPDLLNSGPILSISQTEGFGSEWGSVVVWIGIVRGELNGEGLHVYFSKIEGEWDISHVGGWIS